MFILSVLVLFGAANCHVIRNNPKLHYANLSYVGKDLKTSYTESVSIGTPGQRFNFQLNTEHFYSFIPSVQCSDDFCQKRNKYNSSASSTYKYDGTPFNFVAGDGEYSGLLSIDSVEVGDMTIQNQTFGELLDVESKLNESRIDGVVGLGYKEINTIFDNSVAQGLIDAPIFSTYLKPNQPKIIFGGSDPDLYDQDLLYSPLVSDAPCWQIKFDGIQIERGENVGEGGKACVSLTNNFIEGPSQHVSKINSQIGARKYGPINGTYEVDCSEVEFLPNLFIYVGDGIYFYVGSHFYITQHHFGSKNVCLSIFSESEDKDNTNEWILGHPIVQNTYTEFDYANRRIGFAIAV